MGLFKITAPSTPIAGDKQLQPENANEESMFEPKKKVLNGQNQMFEILNALDRCEDFSLEVLKSCYGL